MNNNKRTINGIFLLDKSRGITSNNALQKIKKLFNIKKAGHTGSLDPLATGMLPICFGRSTKFSKYLLNADKNYFVTAQLGIKTSTGDTEGEIISRKKVNTNIFLNNIENIVKKFIGNIKQIPSMYSAIKYKGKPLYYYARKNIKVSLDPREIKIFNISINNIDKKNNLFSLNILCSKGTYIRKLIEDIGDELSFGAHVIELRRNYILPYKGYNMYTIKQINDILSNSSDNLNKIDEKILNTQTAVLHCTKKIILSKIASFYILKNQAIIIPNRELYTGEVSLFNEKKVFLGIGILDKNGKIFPKKLL